MSEDLSIQLLKLAEDYGINLDSQSSMLESNSNYTSYPIPEGTSRLQNAYKSENIEWNLPGQGAEFKQALYMKIGEEKIQFGPPQEIGGIIVGYFQKNQLSYFDGDKVNSICSVVAYQDPERGLVKGLPNIPCGNIYTWEDKKINRNLPDPFITKLGLVGSRGLNCDECIRGGMSYQEVEITSQDGKTESKTVECEPRGQLLIAVTEITKITKKPNPVKGGDPIEEKSTKSIYELFNEDGEPFTAPLLIAVPMSKSFIRGNSKKGVIGYDAYVRYLERTYRNSPQKNPVFNFTIIRFVMPPEGRVYQPHFQTMGIPSTDEIKKALALYERPSPALLPTTKPPLPLASAVESEEEVPW